MIDTINNPNLLGFYIWAYKNLEQVEYITSQIRKNYPNSDLVISSDNTVPNPDGTLSKADPSPKY